MRCWRRSVHVQAFRTMDGVRAQQYERLPIAVSVALPVCLSVATSELTAHVLLQEARGM